MWLGSAWSEIQLHLHLAVITITDARLVLNREQVLEEVGREVDTI